MNRNENEVDGRTTRPSSSENESTEPEKLQKARREREDFMNTRMEADTGIGLRLDRDWKRSDVVEDDDEYDPDKGLLMDKVDPSELNGYDYTRHSPVRHSNSNGRKFGNGNGSGGIFRGPGYSSMIPPLPSSVRHVQQGVPFQLVETRTQRVTPSSEQEIRRLLTEKLKNTRIYDDPPPPTLPVPFNAKFLGIVKGSFAAIKLNGSSIIAQFNQHKESMMFYNNAENANGKYRLPFDEIEVGRIVVVQWDDNSPATFVRARVVSINADNQTISAKDLDTWRIKNVQAADVYYILPHFLDAPVLVRKCKLKSLEFWNGTNVLVEMIPLIPKVKEAAKVTDCERGNDGILSIVLQVNLKTRSNHSKWASDDEQVSLNTMLMRTIVGFTRVPRTYCRGYLAYHSHVSIVEETGDVWIQMHSILSHKLSSMGESPEQILTSAEYNPYHSRDDEKRMSDFEYAYFERGDRVFLARFLDDRGLYRVKVFEAERGNQKVKVQYLDFGNIETIPVEDLMPVDFVDPILAKIPMQVFRGHLNGIDSIEDIDGFFETVSIHKIQKILVSGFGEQGVPLLDVFVMLNEEDKGYTYVNQLLLDKGLAKGSRVKRPLIPFDQTPPKPEKEKPKLVVRGRDPNPNSSYVHGDSERYYASCRIIDEENELVRP